MSFFIFSIISLIALYAQSFLPEVVSKFSFFSSKKIKSSIAPQCLGDFNRPVFLLKLFDDCNHCPTCGESSVVQSVNKSGHRLSLPLSISNPESSCLIVQAVRVRPDLPEFSVCHPRF